MKIFFHISTRLKLNILFMISIKKKKKNSNEMITIIIELGMS